MLSNLKKRLGRRSVKSNANKGQAKIARAVLIEDLETRTLMSSSAASSILHVSAATTPALVVHASSSIPAAGTAVSGYSSLVTDIQTGGPFASSSAYVNGGINSATGPFQYQSFAVVEFDPANSTVFPGTTVTTPSSLSLSLVNNPSAWNSTSGAAGNVAVGSFDVYLLPTYTATSSLTYQTATAAGLPLGVQGQGGLSGVTASNFFLGTFTPGSAGTINVPLTLPTGTSSAATTLTTDLSTNKSFEIVIAPHSATSEGQFQGESTYYNSTQQGDPGPANGTTPGGDLNESPILSYTSNAVAENIAVPYPAISVDQTAAPLTAGPGAQGAVEINILRNGYAGDTATVNYTTANGTALAGTNFGSPGNTSQISGTITFNPGQTVAVVTVPIIDAGSAADTNFTLTLSSPSSNTTLGATTSTVSIIGTTAAADNIGGLVADSTNTGNPSFVLSTSGTSIQPVAPQSTTELPVNGNVTNGTGDFSTDQYEIISFNASALQSGLNVTSLSSLSLELDNYNSQEGEYNSALNGYGPYPSVNPHVGDFNVYLEEPTPTGTPTSGFSYVGNGANGSGLNPSLITATGAVLLGTTSFDNPDTTQSPVLGNLNNPSGVQDVYTFELSAAAQTFLKNALNATSTSTPAYAPIRLIITAGTPAFAADFANNNSTTGGNYGIQPYLWFNGVTTKATVPAENFAVQYNAISVNANETQVVVDISRSATGYTGDNATVNYTLSNGTAVLGTDYSGPATGSVTFVPGQTTATAIITLINNPAATTEKAFNITLTHAHAGGTEAAATVNVTPTVITIEPPVQPTQTIVVSKSAAAETTSSFGGYAYLNGSVTNGTGSFAFQGYQVLEFPASSFIQPGQQITSLSDISLGLANYENQVSNPGANYGGLAGNFTLYLAGANETTEAYGTERYDATQVDGVGGFTPGTAGAVGPLSPTQVGTIGPAPADFNDYAIPLGVVSFNTKLGLDYFTPSQAALNQQWSVPGITGTISALQLMEMQINAGQNIRIMAAPGDSAFHAYFYGANAGSSGAGGPVAPQLQVVDTIATNESEEAVSFSSASYNVNTNGLQTANVTVVRSDVVGAGLGDTLTVNYATADGNAFAGTNYTAQSGTLTFAPGVTTQTITIPILAVNNPGGDKAFTITLTNPATSDTAHTAYVAPILGTNPTATVFITDNSNNAETLTQYTSSVGDIGTSGPVTFGGSAINPAPPFNYSIFTGGKYTALDFNDSSVINYNDPAEFNGPLGPNKPTGPANTLGPTYVGPAGEPTGTGPVTFAPAGDGSFYSATIANINEITLNFVNFFASSAGMNLNVYLVSDAGSNILPGAQGTSKNPHFYDTTVHNITATLGDGVGTQFGTTYLLGSITNPSTINLKGYTSVPMTSFSATAEALLISALNGTGKFRIIVAPESANTSLNADWIYDYTNANAGYAADTGIPVNYYIQPELSFDVSYASTNAALPAYITPSANADYLWDPTTGNLTVTNGSLTFYADSAADKTDLPVNLTVAGPTASVIFTSSQHLAGLTLTGGATAQVASVGAARTANNHSVLVIGTVNGPAPTFSILGASTLDIADNDMIVHGGDFDAIQALAQQGRNGSVGGFLDGTWTGTGLTSSAAAAQAAAQGEEFTALGVVENADLPLGQYGSWQVGSFNESLAADGNDVIVKYTYVGDWALEGKVSLDAATIFSAQYGTDPSTFLGANSDDAWASGSYNGAAAIGLDDATVFSAYFGNGTLGGANALGGASADVLL